MSKLIAGIATALACAALAAPATAADPSLRPYVLGAESPGTVAGAVAQARRALEGEGFTVVGEYPVSEGAHVVVATSGALQEVAAKTKDGAYGAVVRVSATKVGETVQVAYTNPAWMAAIYRLSEEAAGVSDALGGALGRLEEFGSRDGIPAKKLGNYHYMMFMPYFDEQVTLGTFPSQAEAVAKVEAGLAAASDARKVYRVDVPGAEQTLFGVAILAGEGADAEVMRVTDTGPRRHTAHLPYELLVAGGKVLMLHGKFRIAQSFPDLAMGTFMKISGAPDGIEKVLRSLVK